MSIVVCRNKTGTSKVGAISKAQKAQNTFLGENLKFSKIFLFWKMSHSAEKRGRVTLFDLKTCILLQNNKKLIGGPFGTLKNFREKSRTVPKKNQKGDPLVSAGCVGYVKKIKNERRDPLETENISKKSRTVPKKNRKGDSLVPSGLVGYLEKVKKRKEGPFALSLPWPLGRTWRLRWFQDCF